jgi:hypothetical protein
MKKCSECGNELPGGTQMWEEMTGWALPRMAGGTNALSLRKPTGRFMCQSCMHLKKSRVAAGQGKLI